MQVKFFSNIFCYEQHISTILNPPLLCMGLMAYLFLGFCLINLFNCDNATVNFIEIIMVFYNMARLHWK